MSYIENVDMESVMTEMNIINMNDSEKLQGANLILRDTLDSCNSLFMIMLDIYDPEKPKYFKDPSRSIRNSQVIAEECREYKK